MSNDIIINPKTQRPVKKGSRVYMKLINDGIIERHDDLLINEKATYSDNDNESDIEEMKKQINETLIEDNKHVVKGRGKHKNKLVVRHKITTKNISKNNVPCRFKLVDENLKPKSKHDEDDNYEASLEPDSESDFDINELMNMKL